MSLVIILVLVASTVYADVIHFKSGRKMEGKIIEETKDKITLKTDYAILTFDRNRITSIKYKPYVFKKKKTPPDKATVVPKQKSKRRGKLEGKGGIQPGKPPIYKDTPEFEHPAGLAYVQWSFNNSLGSKDITFDIKIYNALDVSNGIYFGVYSSKINGIPFYLGLQTDVYKSGHGGQGKGVIFSRWETTDKSNVKTEAPTSWAEAPFGEGRTVSLRCKYEWTDHKYRFKISEVSKDSIGVWYGFWVHDYNNNETTFIGSVRFPFTDDNGGLENCGISFIEIYSGTKIINNIPYWHVSIDNCFQDTNEPISAYAYYGKIPNTNIYVREKSVHFEIGSNTVRNNLEGYLFE